MMTNLIAVTVDALTLPAGHAFTGPIHCTIGAHLYEFFGSALEWDALATGPVRVHVYCDQNAQSGVMKWYAFRSAYSREMFCKMIKADGVGPGTAIKIMARTPPSEILKLIREGDAEGIIKLPGVGPKTGEALVAVLIQKEKKKAPKPVPVAKPEKPQLSATAKAVVIGLVGMGWKDTDAAKAIADIVTEHAAAGLTEPAESDLLRLGIQRLRKTR